MPTLKTLKRKTGPDPNRQYVAWDSFATEHDSCRRGEKLPGSHPLVAAAFTYFVQDTVPERDWPSQLTAAIATAERVAADEQAEQAERASRTHERVIALAEISELRVDPATLIEFSVILARKGQWLDADDPLVAKHPRKFAPIAETVT